MKITQKMVEKAHVFAQTMTNYFEPVATTPAGKLVSTLAGYSKATNEHQTAYRLRDTYAEQGETYKEIRSRLYGPYLM